VSENREEDDRGMGRLFAGWVPAPGWSARAIKDRRDIVEGSVMGTAHATQVSPWTRALAQQSTVREDRSIEDRGYST
jgi:hypothetical protein